MANSNITSSPIIRRKIIHSECERCKAPIEFIPSREKRFCSPLCRDNHRFEVAGRSINKGFHCKHCGKESFRKVRGYSDAQKYCSRECSYASASKISQEIKALKRIYINNKPKNTRRLTCKIKPQKISPKSIKTLKPCTSCGIDVIGYGNLRRTCLDCKRKNKSKSKRLQKSIRRAKEANTAIEFIDPVDVFAQDKWSCYLCGINTPMSKRGTYDQDAPELEHVVPLSRGGTHTRGNLRCACRRCNINKGSLTHEEYMVKLDKYGRGG